MRQITCNCGIQAHLHYNVPALGATNPMFSRIKQSARDRKDAVVDQYRMRIREKAISNAKASIALMGKRVEDYDADQLEIIVQKEEQEIIQKYKNSALFGVLALLGIGYF